MDYIYFTNEENMLHITQFAHRVVSKPQQNQLQLSILYLKKKIV